jgi:membrane protein YdbS with pleckstrin-like domain
MKIRDGAIALFLVSTVAIALIELWLVDGPVWALVIVGVPLAVAGLVLAPFIRQGYREERRSDRLKTGRCLACGYSLRGNVSGVCPECGAPVPR